MKKMIKIVLALFICMASMTFLTSCKIDLDNADYTMDNNAKDKEGSVQLIEEFFEETIKEPNFVVTCKNKDGEVQFTETVKGTDDYILTKDGTKNYAFKKGEFFYIASISNQEDDEGNVSEYRYYYCSDKTKPGYYEDSEFGTMEDMYKGSYCTFMSKYNGVMIVELLPEDEGTYNCDSHAEKKDGNITGSLNFEYATSKGNIKINALSEDNKVTTINIVSSDGSDLTWTFVYGNAKIDLPDTDEWDREAEAEEKRIKDNENAIDDKWEFFAETTCAENVVVTVTINGKTSYVQTIVNGMECLDFGDYKIYTYMKEVDSETVDTYYVFDGDTKYYLINDEAFESVVMYYYHMGICLYDSVSEDGASLSCSVEGNTMTYIIKMDDETLATLVATKDGDLVTSATYNVKNDDGNVEIVYTFAYGNGALEEPDLSGFVNASTENSVE